MKAVVADDAVVAGASACGADAARATSTLRGEVEPAEPVSSSGHGGGGGAPRCCLPGAAIATPPEAEGVVVSLGVAGGGGRVQARGVGRDAKGGMGLVTV